MCVSKPACYYIQRDIDYCIYKQYIDGGASKRWRAEMPLTTQDRSSGDPASGMAFAIIPYTTPVREIPS